MATYSGLLRLAAFEQIARFKERVDSIVREITQSRPAKGVERLHVPGSLEAETEALYRRDSIPLNDVTWTGLRAAAQRVGLTLFV